MGIAEQPIEQVSIVSARERLSFAKGQRATLARIERSALGGVGWRWSEWVFSLAKKTREGEVPTLMGLLTERFDALGKLKICQRRRCGSEHLVRSFVGLLGKRSDGIESLGDDIEVHFENVGLKRRHAKRSLAEGGDALEPTVCSVHLFYF
jgi:hypothetical protein